MLTILCISSYEKGFDFMREAKAQGCCVILLTSKSLENIKWPRESIDERSERATQFGFIVADSARIRSQVGACVHLF